VGTLRLGNKVVDTYFSLFGEKENDITYAIGWGFRESPTLLIEFLKHHTKISITPDEAKDALIRLQNYEDDGGFTDIEVIVKGSVFIVIEAKKGWVVPRRDQLMRYQQRFELHHELNSRFIVLSECNNVFAAAELRHINLPFDVIPVSWSDVLITIRKTERLIRGKERHTIAHLRQYLSGVITMQEIESNMVYCVSLKNATPPGWSISLIDMVEKKNKYYYPVGEGGWPEPPNYLAFRYSSKLQYIRHVESYEIVKNLHDVLPEIPFVSTEGDLNYVLNLGPPFKPDHEVKNGDIWPNGRIWCMLDTLFTEETIKAAKELTDKRLEMNKLRM